MAESSVVYFRCPACRHLETCRGSDIKTRLRGLGMLRRATDVTPQVLEELLRTSVARLSCRACGREGLVIERDEFSEEWETARRCQQCHCVIPPARLEVLPQATRCAHCQGAADAQGDVDADVEPEYCPRCGDILQLRQTSAGGTARYRMVCPNCRR